MATRLPRPSPIDASMVPTRSISSCSAAYDRGSASGARIAGAPPCRAFCAARTSRIVCGSGVVCISRARTDGYSGLATLVERRRNPRVREVFAQMLDILAAERIAAMRTMQDAFGAVQLHADAGARQRLDRCTEMTQQRLDLPPLQVPADRIVKDRADQVVVLVAHRRNLILPAQCTH